MKKKNPKEIVLQVEELRKSYAQSHFFTKKITAALRELNFKIFRNEIFAMIGLNGSGKTTTLKILLGLLKKDSGSFKIFGSPQINNAVKRKIGYMPEIPSFNTDFTPMEMLSIWGSLSDIKKERIPGRIKEVLNYTSLSHAADRKIKGFSKGMLQRLGLAQALLAEPQLLILDEPMGGLDPQGIIDIRNLMLKLSEDGKTIFFTSHIISEVERVAHRVGVLHRGRGLQTIPVGEKLEEKFLDMINLKNEQNISHS